ncbi:MAG: chemotaxis protein CheA [Anaerocolumna sp.]|jgi:two-component system chemotaxis sensor kinase CheA|nr:chemotaxis protein CheA [Anaerocolumna sp.]
MSNQFTNEPLLDMFIFESTQLLEQLEQTILSNEKESGYSQSVIHEIFRIMHTIKGSSAMMLYNEISQLAHTIEDLFFYLREEIPNDVDYNMISDLVLESVDFIKIELEKIKNNETANGDASEIINNLKNYLHVLKINNLNTNIELKQDLICEKSDKPDNDKKETKQYYIGQQKKEAKNYAYLYKATIFFEEGCEMENIRAYTILHNLKDITDEINYIPEDIIDSDDSIDVIRREGFQIYLKTNKNYEEMNQFFMQTIFLKSLDLIKLENDDEYKQFIQREQEITLIKEKSIKIPVVPNNEKEQNLRESSSFTTQQSIISVSVSKLDRLMDLMGEMVIAEAMVIQNPDLVGLELDNFGKAARQLNKITTEIQDMVMAIRMVQLSATFQKMNRIVRDMCKKLKKEVSLNIIGEETEVDKNIIEHISDPIMHLVRNAIDHGIESADERQRNGKQKSGTITLEAKNAGNEVIVIVKDDGKGLSKDKILKKAMDNNLLYKDEHEMSDKEIFNMILLPGFSTKDTVTEFSGRGVGMDVVTKNIETIGGSLTVDSVDGKGTTITLKIPLTLAIIDGMNIKVGNSCYTIPTTSIKESFRPTMNNIIKDPDDNEMIMVRGRCFPVMRLHERYKVETLVTDLTKGIIIMVEQDEKTLCIFADELVGQQQVVVKALPDYISNFKKIKGLAGCTLLGDGSISLILDIAGLINY